MGPILQRATRPKLLSSEYFFLAEAIPIPKAIINGTVTGPVVTPPESNATARNSFGTKNESINTNE